MATVFKSALRFLSGSAKRDELAGELSDKLYAGRGNSATMSELGIELEKPGAKPSIPAGLTKPGAVSSASAGGPSTANSQPAATLPAKRPQAGDPPSKSAQAGEPPAKGASSRPRRSPCSGLGEGEGEPRAVFDSHRARRDVRRAHLPAAARHQKMISCSRLSPLIPSSPAARNDASA